LHCEGVKQKLEIEFFFTLSILKLPLDLRRELLGNMLIVGGVTRLPGFLARLKVKQIP
jgi:actin-related protein